LTSRPSGADGTGALATTSPTATALLLEALSEMTARPLPASYEATFSDDFFADPPPSAAWATAADATLDVVPAVEVADPAVAAAGLPEGEEDTVLATSSVPVPDVARAPVPSAAEQPVMSRVAAARADISEFFARLRTSDPRWGERGACLWSP
jgi:hypothetical protein